MDQPDLFPEQRPRITTAEIIDFCRALEGRGWCFARQIATLRPEWDERRVRELASQSCGRVLSYPGSPGYKLTAEASAAEIETAVTKLRHQATEMRQRAQEIDRAAYESRTAS